METELLTIPQFCEITNTGRTNTYKKINSGELKAVKLGKKTLIPRSAVQDFIASLSPYKSEGSAKNGEAA